MYSYYSVHIFPAKVSTLCVDEVPTLWSHVSLPVSNLHCQPIAILYGRHILQ